MSIRYNRRRRPRLTRVTCGASASMLLLVSPLLLAAEPAPFPDLILADLDERGCGRPALADGTRLRGGAEDLCVREVLVARLEEPPRVNVVLTVEMPDTELRLFIYRLTGGTRLEPRFLGSGLRGSRLVEVRRDKEDGWLLVRVLSGKTGGELRVLRCRLEQFPLVCHPSR